MRISHIRKIALPGCIVLLLAFNAVAGEPATTAEQPTEKKDTLIPAPPEPPSILGPDVVPIDLPSALRLAGVDNPEILVAQQRILEAVAIRQFAAAQILPNINVGTNYDLHRGPLQQSTGNILKVNRDALYVGLGANAVGSGTVSIPGIQYNLNIGEAVFANLRARQLVVRQQYAAIATRNDILLEVCNAYLDLLRAEATRAVLLQTRSEAAEVVRLTRAYAQTGQGRQSDADRATSELLQRDNDIAQIEADMLAASARLCALVNLDPSCRLHVVDAWAVPCQVVPDPIPLSELIAIALLQRPELGERRAEIQESLLALSNAKLLPFSPNMIVGFSSGTFGGGSNLVAAGITQPDGTVLRGPRFGDFSGRSDFDAVFFWTVRNLGIGNLALVRQAQARLQANEFRQLETLNRVRREVAEAKARTLARWAQIGTNEQAVRVSQEGFKEDLIRIRGREGLPIEVTNSLNLLGRARREYLDAIIGYDRAQFALYVALGQPPADKLARPVPTDLVPAPPIPASGLLVCQPEGPAALPTPITAQGPKP